MTTGKSLGAVVGCLGLILSTALVSGGVGVSRVGSPTPTNGTPPWAAHLATADAALTTGDVTAALTAWQAAYGAALASRQWEGFADVADAYLRIGRASGAPAGAVPRARDLYLSALFRARDAGSIEGVLRVATAFEGLGDRDVKRQALRMARRLAGPNPDPSLRHRLAELEHEPAAPPAFETF
jgi:hypothetical protein